MNLALTEKETIILFNEGESAASLYTYNGRLKALAEEYAAQNPGKVARYKVDETGALSCEFPKSDLRVLFKKPKTEKQIQAVRENLRKAREKLGKPQSPQG